MELLPQEIKDILPALYTTEGEGDKPVIVKFFNPVGAGTWYICEGQEQANGDWLLFGLCDLGFGMPEWGYVSLNELESVSLPLGMGIERDVFFAPRTLSSEV
tara:strand:- start:859 stop:1164 length:306 start_codon:yes stop_codon:yes gene_type:complete